MRRRNSFVLKMPFIASMMLLAAMVCVPELTCAQETQTVIHEFTGKAGEQPAGDLIADSSGNLYGTAAFGGVERGNVCPVGCGVVFELSPIPGGGWRSLELHRFIGGREDGQRPLTGLARDSSGNLYGTTAFGGHYGGGVAFEISRTSNGVWKETVLFHFGGGNLSGGAVPLGRLAIDQAGNLYGTATQGGNTSGVCADRFSGGCGIVFELSPSSSGLWTGTVLYTFTGGADGAYSQTGLTFDAAGNLYGTASGGGNSGCSQALNYGCGVVFELSPNPSGPWTETVLYTFSGSDGSAAVAPLIFDVAGNLYGTTEAGGSATGCKGGCGVVFQLSQEPAGWSETVLHTFQPGTTGWGDANGGQPESGVHLDASGNLFGTTYSGGTTTACGDEGCGVIYELSLSGSTWTEIVLHSFSGGSDGSGPYSSLTLGEGGSLFGSTFNGGNTNDCTGGCGVVYQITP